MAISSIRSTSLNSNLTYHCCYQGKKFSNVVRIFGLSHNNYNEGSLIKFTSKKETQINVINKKCINGASIDQGSCIKSKEIEGNNKDNENPFGACMLGKFIEGRYVYRQTFIIRSYEIGPDKTATMETLMNLLQEIALNHVTSSGLAGNGFGATREMSLRNLIWVVTRVHIQVSKYSSWGDVVEIDTWVDSAGKNGMRRDWIMRDYRTRQIITKATSTWVTMNRETRKLSKFPEEVRKEVEPFYHHTHVLDMNDHDSHKINKLTDKTANVIRSGLAPRWNDMDANQHVNNVKYIGWILESVPIKVLEEYEMGSMTLEYRRECRQANMLESLTTLNTNHYSPNLSTTCSSPEIESTHLLRLQDDKVEIVRARTKWHPKIKF